jgi:peptide/nickel transport system permease protein
VTRRPRSLALRETLGLNLPLPQQFFDFLQTIVTRGDTGDSLVYGVPTRDLILERVPISLVLIALATVITVVIAVTLALAAARNQNGVIDHIVRIIPTITLGMPGFWVGLLLIIVFAVALRWFPVGNIGDGPWGMLHSLVLPAVTISLGLAPPLIRSLREQLLEVYSADFVTTLRAARVPERRIAFGHVLRNAAAPTTTLLGVNIAYMIGGTLVIERVFGINGLGTLLFNAIGNRDFPLVQGIALYSALGVVVITIVVDVIVRGLDPRGRAR